MVRALIQVFPELSRELEWASLGELPTPITRATGVMRELGAAGELYVKRDDLSSPIYGGNKVRTLELLFGDALRAGAQRIYATGAYGSNHATATVLHAPRVGLEPGAVLFAQPYSQTAADNLRVTLGRSRDRLLLPHWSLLPYGMFAARRRSRRAGRRPYVMVPGGATPLGALGYVSAAFELAEQIRRGELPSPQSIVVGVGSTCTSAGLLVGLHHAARLGIGFEKAPLLRSIRVSPWPVTARFRILALAVRASRFLAVLTGKPELELSAAELGQRFEVDGGFLGAGYGLPTPSGREAIALFAGAELAGLDTTYSAKAAAGAIAALRAGAQGPIVFWSTKSSVPLPAIAADELAGLPRRTLRFLER
ncbi:MAG TPA: pyridoxal-phosphate dependent enzyme [Polyangiaceae bacterium]|nr:pyridoxal-phosphate dependent enzyme [Polyangiaceae bacterium]